MRYLIITVLAVLWGVCSYAQSIITDTLQAARKTAVIQKKQLNLQVSSPEALRMVLSPTGEGDPVKAAQTLPGVTSGTEGFSAMFVRGGNSGNNLITLDGVPLYGNTHLLGLTTAVPVSVLSQAAFRKGGFDGRQGNYTASCLALLSKDVITDNYELDLSNFMAGADAAFKINQNMSVILAGRVSPVAWEYKGLRKWLNAGQLGIEQLEAGVYDLYGKLILETASGKGKWSFSAFRSSDAYSFGTLDGSCEKLGWEMTVGRAGCRWDFGKIQMDAFASYSNFSNRQEQMQDYRGQENAFAVKSGLKEARLDAEMATSITPLFDIKAGLQAVYAFFNPGQIAGVDNQADIAMANVSLEATLSPGNRFSVTGSLRGNTFWNHRDNNWRFEPEGGLSASWSPAHFLTFEATVDRTVQFYHFLEGLPLGWSLDLLVPSGNDLLPERAWQYSLSSAWQVTVHNLSVGVFYKQLSNLLYLKESGKLLSSSMAAWRDNIDSGSGTSKGIECLYEYSGPGPHVRISYTWSKTDRSGFAKVNDGLPFHATFDRTHVLNASLDWGKLSLGFLLQSGHWENGAPSTYRLHLPDREWTANYYSSINNFRMPTIIRLDARYRFEWGKGQVRHTLSIGACNILNRFNPTMLYFNTKTEQWNYLAFLPILPNFSYLLRFRGRDSR